MPSNTQKLSQLIAQLQTEFLAVHGDIDCVLQVSEHGAAIALDGRNINVTLDLPGGRLPAPVVVFGISRDAAGVLTNSPGQTYQVTPDGRDDWDHDRDAAPAGKTVIAWTRNSGALEMHRNEAGEWFYHDPVLERPIHYVKAGVLGWRLPDET